MRTHIIGPAIEGRGHHSSLRAKQLLATLCASALPMVLSPAVRAEDPAALTESAREEAANHAVDFAFDHLGYLKLEPSAIDFNRLVLDQDLQLVIQHRDAIADHIMFLNYQLNDARAKTLLARDIVSNLQSQLLQGRSSFTLSRYVASSQPLAGIDYHFKLATATAIRVYDLQDSLSQARATLDQATRFQRNLQLNRAVAYGGLGLSQVDVYVAKANLGVFNAVAPHVNFAIDAAQNLYGWSGVVQDGIKLTYPMQPADFNYNAHKFTFDAGATLGTALTLAPAEILGGAMGLYELHSKWRDLNNALVAPQHQREAQSLAFGGVLSTANLPRLSFAPTPIDLTSGGSFKSDPNDRLSIAGVWIPHRDVASDRFSAASRYAFNGLETTTGHVLTGYGIVSRDRHEMNQPFSLSSLFDIRDTQNITQTTRRYESYNDSFNGAAPNQAILRAAESSPHLTVGPSMRTSDGTRPTATAPAALDSTKATPLRQRRTDDPPPDRRDHLPPDPRRPDGGSPGGVTFRITLSPFGFVQVPVQEEPVAIKQRPSPRSLTWPTTSKKDQSAPEHP